MNPPLAFTDAQTQLALLTSQEANFTFSGDELQQALETAWNDTYVCSEIFDDSLTFESGTWQYTVPGTVTVVRELMYTRTTTDSPERISSDLYEIVDNNIQFFTGIERWLITGTTIYVKGLVKLTTDDVLGTAELVNYVLYTAALMLLNSLVFKNAFVFLRNDITMVDISRAIQIMEGQVIRYRQALRREFESA